MSLPNAPSARTEGSQRRGQDAPRICMPTSRDFIATAYRCSLYEAQDVLAESDDVDLIRLQPERGFRIKEAWHRRLTYRDFTKTLISLNPGLRPVNLTRDYDLFVAVCQNHWDLLYLNAIKGWKDHCKISVCWLDEFWAADIESCRNWLPALKQFDYVFVGGSGTVAPLSQAIDHPCRWLPGAVDAIRFSPYPNPPPRTIDVYSIGRRWEGIHQALLAAARRQEIFYVHDTFPAMANLEPYDPRQHRELFANVAKRSRYFTVAPGKMNLESETRGQVEIGYRYYEAAAAGAVMIGQPPACPGFAETFNWPDAVVSIRPDGSDVMEVLSSLDAARICAISRRNAAQALLRHDWVHRWAEILKVSGLQPSPKMEVRLRRLQQLANEATSATQSFPKAGLAG